ncbi:MAG: Cache 3/Cache 2 fusion domain-containing protein, partial [Spirochaetes bacterium]|nr:Cache 3/Cache 2 fusion domain-containing protein [Spirochaetota bacterium]
MRRPSPGTGLRGRGLAFKIAILIASSAAISVVVLVAIAASLSRDFGRIAQAEVDELIDADLRHVVTGVYNLVKAEDDAIRELLSSHLAAARRSLRDAGGAGLGAITVRWTATDQFTGQRSDITLPRMTVGGAWLGRNLDPGSPSPVVDEVTGFAGATATIFQLMESGAGMIRVATSVLDAAGRRAIGTYIPTRGPDGSENPVIAAVMRGESYRGRAYVVNSWYLTEYEPIRDASDAIVGMLYVGVPQRSAESRIRQAILGTVLGETGYVWVITGTGEDKGRYVISRNGLRDGELIWDERDAEGHFVTREIIDAAIALDRGTLGRYRYRWRNADEPEARWKLARLAYYEPWDWVIGAGVYVDEVSVYTDIIEAGRARTTGAMAAAGFVIAALVGLGGLATARGITEPLRAMTRAAEAMTAGDLRPVSDMDSGDEIGTLAEAFNSMAGRIRAAMDGLKASEEKYRGIYENAMEGMFRTSFDGRLLDANPALARMLGYASAREAIELIDDIAGRVYENPSDRETFLANLRENGFVEGMEARFKKKDGSVIRMLMSARRIAAPQGGGEYIEGFIADIDRLKNAEERLLGLLEEKDALIHEVHHRVRNNLQVIVSMLDLQAHDAMEAGPKALLGRIKQRILSMSLVHDGLVRSRDLASVDFGEYAGDLIGTLASRSSDSRPAVVSIDAAGIRLPLETAVPCGLAFGEYASNALTHAFPAGWEGERRVDVRMRAEGPVYRLTIRDTGAGLPRGFDPSDAPTLGFRLAEAAVKQMRGTVSAIPGSGTTIRVEFP